MAAKGNEFAGKPLGYAAWVSLLYTKKSSEWVSLHVGPVFSSLSIEKSSFGKDGWRVSRSVFSLIHLSFSTGTPKVYFLWKNKLALFSFLTAADPVIHIQLPLSNLGQLLGDLWNSEILPHSFPIVLSDEKELNWALKFRFCRSGLN